MRRSKRLKRAAIYQLARLLISVFNHIPRSAAQAIGAWIGIAAWSLLAKDRHRINRHLSLILGDNLTTREKSVIGRDFFVNSGKNLADVVRLKYNFEEIRSLITIEGQDHVDAAFAEGKGVLGITGHIGNFELMAAYLASLGYPAAVIARDMYDPRLQELLRNNRQTSGLTIFATTTSPREMLRWLKNNGGLGVLIDTDSTRVRGELIPMFGRPANTPIGPFLLGVRAGSVFLPMACIRTENNRYKIIIRPRISVDLTADIMENARKITAACVRELEMIILANKSQWIWLHNRWHTKPENSA